MGAVQLARIHRVWHRLPHLHRRGLMVLAFVLVVLISWPTEESGPIAAVYLPPELSHLDAFNDHRSSSLLYGQSLREQLQLGDGPQESSNYEVETYDISSGDSLSGIFDRMGFGQSVMYQIVSADASLLALDVLRSGNRLTFTSDKETGTLEKMELYIHDGNRVIYRRVAENEFEYEERIVEGDWPSRVISGEIVGSFYVSGRNAGLSDREVSEISRLMEDQLNFSRDIRAGDEFEVVISEQMVNGRATGQTRIEAIRIHRARRSHTAFRFDEGNFYDEDGDSLVRAFMRRPSDQNYRVTSSFNPQRKHPVTGRVAPHNGTDFAMSTGTPVLTTGDGVVTRVENHPFAGKYVEVSHGTRYTTRYLHLDRIDVRQGQEVDRGQRIGLSGATGRVTGAHLHFELHINGRPVDPMTADIPMEESLPEEKMDEFQQQVNQLVAFIEDNSETDLASQ